MAVTGTIRDDPAHKRFALEVDGHTASLYYRLEPGVITLVHTEVPPALGGQGIGAALVRGVLDMVRARAQGDCKVSFRRRLYGAASGVQ